MDLVQETWCDEECANAIQMMRKPANGKGAEHIKRHRTIPATTGFVLLYWLGLHHGLKLKLKIKQKQDRTEIDSLYEFKNGAEIIRVTFMPKSTEHNRIEKKRKS